MKEKKLKVQVTLTGRALELVLSTQKKYENDDSIRGKSKIINQLLTKLSDSESVKKQTA